MKKHIALPLIAAICAFTTSCGGSNSSDSEINSVQVFISNGSIHCGFEGNSPAQTAQLLIQNGIDVIESQCGIITGLARPAVCGSATDEVNIHTIFRANQNAAEELGFQPESNFNNQAALSLSVVPCEN